MRQLGILVVGVAFAAAPFLLADVVNDVATADIVVLGEFHDNPAHHAIQSEYLDAVLPKAVVFEMLTPTEAEALKGTNRAAADMIDATAGFHWSNITDYADLLAKSPVIVGAALPSDSVRRAFASSAASEFEGDAVLYGLATALPEAQQSAREDLQFKAHCDAMPKNLMSGMVEAQRLRDAQFARVTLTALDRYGSPIVLITGNGHARIDWGVPAYLNRVRPGISVFALGQGEDTALDAPFSKVEISAAPQRDDPCAAFQ